MAKDKPKKERGAKKKKRRGWLGNAILIVMFLAGLLILTYPMISSYWNTRIHAQSIAGYNDSVSQMTKRDFTEAWAAVDEYNARIAAGSMSFNPTAAELAEYNKLLDPSGTGMMGHIEISKLGVDLPVYHTVEEGVLQVGVGHIPGSSLPGGGPSTHVVLSGHRGLPTSKLFTDLDAMDVGDVFLLHMLDRTMAYQVDQVRIVEPTEVNDLRIEEGKDYCTLVTCTPYAINTHRLLVRGHRVDYLDQGYVPADAVKIDSVLVASIISVPVFMALFIILLVATAQRNKDNRRKREAMERVGGNAGEQATTQEE